MCVENNSLQIKFILFAMNYYFDLALREMNQGSGSGYIAGAILLILAVGETISRANGLSLLKGQQPLNET